MSNEITIRAGNQLASIEPATREFTKAVGMEFANKAPAGSNPTTWVDDVAREIGGHPPQVFSRALGKLKRTCRFWPTTADIIDALLSAYGDSEIPLNAAGLSLYLERQESELA